MIAFILLGIVVYTFVFWKSLKEDYAPDMIFNTALLAIFISTVLASLCYFLYQPLWFWSGFLGMLLGTTVGIRVYKLRKYEVYDASIISFLYLQVILLLWFIFDDGLYNLILLGLTVMCIVLYYFLQANYRKFSWYKSGKVGFSGFTVLGTYFIGRSVIAVFSLPVVSLSGVFDIIISAVFVIVSFAVVYTLSKVS